MSVHLPPMGTTVLFAGNRKPASRRSLQDHLQQRSSVDVFQGIRPDISRRAFLKLCRQYPIWLQQAAEQLGLHGGRLPELPDTRPSFRRALQNPLELLRLIQNGGKAEVPKGRSVSLDEFSAYCENHPNWVRDNAIKLLKMTPETPPPPEAKPSKSFVQKLLTE